MRSPVEKIVAHRATNYPNARWMWQEFCEEHRNMIVDCKKYDFFRTVLSNGEVHYFVPNGQWFEWTRGRTYWFDDELWHSDFKLKESGSGEL